MTAIPMKANQPDSVYLFSYAKHGGTSGLRFAWSADGKQNRMPVCGDFEYEPQHGEVHRQKQRQEREQKNSTGEDQREPIRTAISSI